METTKVLAILTVEDAFSDEARISCHHENALFLPLFLGNTANHYPTVTELTAVMQHKCGFPLSEPFSCTIIP